MIDDEVLILVRVLRRLQVRPFYQSDLFELTGTILVEFRMWYERCLTIVNVDVLSKSRWLTSERTVLQQSRIHIPFIIVRQADWIRDVGKPLPCQNPARLHGEAFASLNALEATPLHQGLHIEAGQKRQPMAKDRLLQ